MTEERISELPIASSTGDNDLHEISVYNSPGSYTSKQVVNSVLKTYVFAEGVIVPDTKLITSEDGNVVESFGSGVYWRVTNSGVTAEANQTDGFFKNSDGSFSGFKTLAHSGGAYLGYQSIGQMAVSDDALSGNRIQIETAATSIIHNTEIVFDSPKYTYSQLTALTVPYLNTNKQLVSSAVTQLELGYLSGATSSIQTQLNSLLTGTLANTKIFIGNGSNVATAQTLSLNAAGGGFALGNTGVITLPDSDTSTRGLLLAADWNTFNSKESALTFSTGLTRSTNTITVNTSQNIAKLSNLTTNGFVKTSSSDGTLSVDTTTYLSSNQSITISGDATGSGTTSIALSVTKINNTSLAGLATGILKNTTSTGVPSIAVAADFPTLNQNTTGSAASLTNARTIGGVSFDGTTNITVASATGGFTITGGAITVTDQNIVLSATTGTKVGTATTQKLSFFNSTPIVQPTGDVSTALQNLGLIASATITSTTNANLTGVITSIGNATSIASQTGTGTKFVVDTAPTVSGLTMAAGTTTIAPINFTAWTNPVTSPLAGQMNYDGLVHYSTHINSARGVINSSQYSIVSASNFSLSSSGSAQSCFETTGDVWTLNANTTYIIEGFYHIIKTVSVSTVAMGFLLGGSASVTAIKYVAFASDSAANAVGTAPSMTNINTVSSTVVNVASTGDVAIWFRGVIRMNVGGAVTPQITFSLAPTSPSMRAGSFIMFTPIGSDTNNTLGNVS